MIRKAYVFVCLIGLIINTYVNAQTPEIKWSFDTKSFAAGQAAAADLDGDGKLEIAFGCYRNDGSLYILNSEDGSLLWRYQPHDPGREGCNDVAMLIYDINADAKPEVIMASSCTPVTTCFNGKTGEIIWQAETGGSDSPPTIADIDGDGKMEIIHGEFLGWVRCLDAETGSLKWRMLVNDNSWIQTAPTIVDLDGDGGLDFVVGTWHFNELDSLYAFDGTTREILWTTPVHSFIYHGTSVVDFDGDNKPELLFGSWNNKMYCLNGEDGTIDWTYEGKSIVACPVTIGDIDADGECEAMFTSWYEAIALKSDGTVKWIYEIPDYSSTFRGIALSDINNDIYPDCIFGTSSGLLIGLNGNTGSEIFSINLADDYGTKPFDINHQPLIADFDDDGLLDAFVVGGYGVSAPTIDSNYGRAYMVSLGKGKGPDWLMFQHDVRRQSSLCYDYLTSVEEINSPELNSSPNPATDFIEISFGSGILSEAHPIRTFDMLGIEILNNFQFSTVNSQLRLDVSHLSPGVYFVRVGNVVRKFVKL
jgi:outer membrane protein assembly factor BamB